MQPLEYIHHLDSSPELIAGCSWSSCFVAPLQVDYRGSEDGDISTSSDTPRIDRL